jgi:hypothetical protein
MKRNDIGAIITIVVCIVGVILVYRHKHRRRGEANGNTNQYEAIPESPVVDLYINESEAELIEKIRKDWLFRFSGIDYVNLIASTPSYKALHEMIVDMRGNEMNFHELASLAKISKQNKPLHGTVLNMMKTWTRNETARLRDKSLPRSNFIKQKA